MSIGRQLFGLEDSGKRIYRFQEGEVDREQFEYCQALTELVFGHAGYVDTLGPTWNMVHDPRFEAMEQCFLHTRKTVFGGDPRQGTQTSLPDGTFVSGVQELEQYSEILSEGRYYHDVVVKMGIDPHTVYTESDEFLWKLLKQENPMQFDRKGKPNLNANTYFKMLRADLLGLIADYAEVAKVQEWVLLEENGKLVEEEDIKEYEETGGKPHVWLEIDLLEKALTFRAELRVTAAKILSLLGVDEAAQLIVGKLTDGERDTLLKMVYASKWPDDRLELYQKVTGWFTTLNMTGTYEQRLEAEKARLSKESREVIAGLKDGSILPITRYTEPVIEVATTPEEQAMEDILNNPLKQFILTRVTDAESRMTSFSVQLELYDEEQKGQELSEEQLGDRQSLLDSRSTLSKVVELLLPALEGGYVVDDEEFNRLMAEAEKLDPRISQLVTIQGDAEETKELAEAVN